MPVMVVKAMKQLLAICEKCGHKWFPRKGSPRQCPKCWSRKVKEAAA